GAARARLHPAPAGALSRARPRSPLERAEGQRRQRPRAGGLSRRRERRHAGRAQRDAPHVPSEGVPAVDRELGADGGLADPVAAPGRGHGLRGRRDARAARGAARLSGHAAPVARAGPRRLAGAVLADRVPQGRPRAAILHDADDPRHAPRHHAPGAPRGELLSRRRGDREGDLAPVEMGGPEMAPQTPQPLVAPRRSRGAPRPHTLVAPRRSRGAPRPQPLVAPPAKPWRASTPTARRAPGEAVARLD